MVTIYKVGSVTIHDNNDDGRYQEGVDSILGEDGKAIAYDEFIKLHENNCAPLRKDTPLKEAAVLKASLLSVWVCKEKKTNDEPGQWPSTLDTESEPSRYDIYGLPKRHICPSPWYFRVDINDGVYLEMRAVQHFYGTGFEVPSSVEFSSAIVFEDR